MLGKNISRQMFMTMSSVMARPGTWCELSTDSCLTVRPSRAIPNRAREPSIVAVFIESSRPAQRHTTSTPPKKSPTIAFSTSIM